MKNKGIIIGLILIIIGIILVSSGYYGITKLPEKNSISEVNSGNEYITEKFNFTKNDELIVIANSNDSGLIKESNLSEISQNNLTKYTITPSKTSNDTFYFSNISGNYVFVIFSNKTPSVNYGIKSFLEFFKIHRFIGRKPEQYIIIMPY